MDNKNHFGILIGKQGKGYQKEKKWENVNTLGWDLENGGSLERKQEMLRNLNWITLG